MGVQAFVASIAALPSELWAERLPEELREATGGSPLLLLETLQLVIEGGLLARTDGVWSSPRPSVLFATLGTGGALHQRVERLDRVERWVLTLRAVAGVPLMRDALTPAAGRTDGETASALGSLERRGLVARHGEMWSPSHDEIAAKVVELATPDAIRAAARSLGRVMLDADSRDTRSLRRAGRLLAQADDRGLLRVAFSRFAHLAREAGDRQPNRALANDFLGERASDDLSTELVGSLPFLTRIGLFSTRRQVVVGTTIAVTPATLLLAGMLRRAAARCHARDRLRRRRFDRDRVPRPDLREAARRRLDRPRGDRPPSMARPLRSDGGYPGPSPRSQGVDARSRRHGLGRHRPVRR
jgi:hypothetical protein